jgi:hypothetical protein
MPGRWAAPPAPAMSTLRPRAAAVCPYSSIRCGVRWAETTRTSAGTPNSARASAAARIVLRSESLPMTTPTTGAPFSFSGDSVTCSLLAHSSPVPSRGGPVSP